MNVLRALTFVIDPAPSKLVSGFTGPDITEACDELPLFVLTGGADVDGWTWRRGIPGDAWRQQRRRRSGQQRGPTRVLYVLSKRRRLRRGRIQHPICAHRKGGKRCRSR